MEKGTADINIPKIWHHSIWQLYWT